MRRANANRSVYFVLLAGLLTAIPAEAQAPYPFRLLTARMALARGYHTATRLDDGRVLIVGGPLSTAATEIFDPVTETFSLGPSMSTRRYLHTATRLQNGDVLIVGGSANPGDISTAEIYRAATGTFETVRSIPGARAGHTATVLNDGRVLMVGGNNAFGRLSSALIFDPATETFSPTGAMNHARIGHEATLLSDGRVLITGGAPASLTVGGMRAFAEIYDPATGTFEVRGSMPTARYFHTASVAGSGALIFGGVPDVSAAEPLGTGDRFSESEGAFLPDDRLMLPRADHTATHMPDGSVLFVGGNLTAPHARMVESHNATTGGTRIAGFLVTPRIVHTATLLHDGRVLILGGMDQNRHFVSTAEIYPGADPTLPLHDRIAALSAEIAQLEAEIAGFDTERAALMTEIARLQAENDELRRQLANVGAPTGTGTMSGSGQVSVGRSRHVFELNVNKAADGNLKLSLDFKVCEQLATQSDEDLTCLSKTHRLTVSYFTAVQFSDDPSFVPSPDPAKQGVDTLMLSGVGSWDGVDGHWFTVTATDRGDVPGPNTDTFEIVVTNEEGTTVASVAGTLAAGTLEAR